ncbi:hypothetical protein H4R99_004836, partial [Coemansia sp. RSA 1722]
MAPFRAFLRYQRLGYIQSMHFPVNQQGPRLCELRLRRWFASKDRDVSIRQSADQKHKNDAQTETEAEAAEASEEVIGFDVGFRDGYQAGFDVGRKFANDLEQTIERDRP